MTVATTSSSITLAGNGSTTSFNYNFLIPQRGTEVISITDPYGAVTTLASGQYSITGLGSSSGGFVTYPLAGAPLGSNFTITIARVLPFTQTVSLSNQGSFYPTAVEAALDYTMMAIQQVANITASPMMGATLYTAGEGGTVPAPLAGQQNYFLRGDGTWASAVAAAGLATVATTGSYTDLTNKLSAFGGDAGSGGTAGLVPAPHAGDAAAGRYLKADGTWTAPPTGGGGTTYPGGSSGQIQYNNGGSFGGVTIGGDATFNAGTGAFTVTKTSGTSFAASATTDTTNATNISTGTLAAARVGDLSGTYLTVSTASSTYAPKASPTFTGTPAAPTAAATTNTGQIATTAFVATSFAPLASPALTGTPTAPTAAGATNTTQIATTAFVQSAVSGIALTGYAQFYTGSTQNASNLPVGSVVLAYVNSYTAPNQSATLYYSTDVANDGTNSIGYSQLAGGTYVLLTGTWRSRGGSSGSPLCLYQRVA